MDLACQVLNLRLWKWKLRNPLVSLTATRENIRSVIKIIFGVLTKTLKKIQTDINFDSFKIWHWSSCFKLATQSKNLKKIQEKIVIHSQIIPENFAQIFGQSVPYRSWWETFFNNRKCGRHISRHSGLLSIILIQSEHWNSWQIFINLPYRTEQKIFFGYIVNRVDNWVDN